MHIRLNRSRVRLGESRPRLVSRSIVAMPKFSRTDLDSNSDSARRLSEASSLTDLVALQVKLAGMQTEQAADLWTRAWRTAGETQVAMLGQVNSQVGQLSDRMRETYSAATRVVENAVNNGEQAEQRRSA